MSPSNRNGSNLILPMSLQDVLHTGQIFVHIVQPKYLRSACRGLPLCLYKRLNILSIEYFSNEFSSSTWSKSFACPCTSSTFFLKEHFFLLLKNNKGAHCAFFHGPDLPSSHFASLSFHSSNDFKKGYLIHRPDCFLPNLLSDQLAN